ncbi:MAG: zinc ribbon domain-containing protein [Salinigranum sp.]
MSKITFRADEELVRQLEEFDASKSEVMRKALREYLDGAERTPRRSASDDGTDDGTIGGVLAARIDALIEERLDARLANDAPGRSSDRDVHVNINVEGNPTDASVGRADEGDEPALADERKTRPSGDRSDRPRECDQCGERVSSDHVYCPNCGEKATHRVFCECGDELRSDWAFCPGCGRRTPAADVLDRS